MAKDKETATWTILAEAFLEHSVWFPQILEEKISNLPWSWLGCQSQLLVAKFCGKGAMHSEAVEAVLRPTPEFQRLCFPSRGNQGTSNPARLSQDNPSLPVKKGQAQQYAASLFLPQLQKYIGENNQLPALSERVHRGSVLIYLMHIPVCLHPLELKARVFPSESPWFKELTSPGPA